MKSGNGWKMLCIYTEMFFFQRGLQSYYIGKSENFVSEIHDVIKGV